MGQLINCPIVTFTPPLILRCLTSRFLPDCTIIITIVAAIQRSAMSQIRRIAIKYPPAFLSGQKFYCKSTSYNGAV